jgi:Protein of unknown function (DUF2442)
MAVEKRVSSKIDEAVFAKASERGRKVLARGPLAISARYEDGRIHVELNNGCAFIFPVENAQELVGAKISQLRAIEVTSAGLGLYWPKLETDLYVPSLVKGVLGTKDWMAKIGASGGRVSTPTKAAASRNNGKLGGRPKGVANLEVTS